jgi:threonine/homoserine/homoserine lactone efflux protein
LVGLTINLTALSLGFGAVLTTFPQVYLALKVVGFSYIVYLAFMIVRSIKSVDAKEAAYIGFGRAIALQFVNPKAWIVAATLTSTLIPVGGGWTPTVIAIALFLVTTWPGAFIWASIGQSLASLLNNTRRRTVFNWTSAILLVASMIPALLV